jgi:hypothetical protein
MDYNPPTSAVVCAYKVDITSRSSEDPEVVDILCDCEDIIINTALREYAGHYNGGDERTYIVYIINRSDASGRMARADEHPKYWTTVRIGNYRDLVTTVEVVVNSAQVRF